MMSKIDKLKEVKDIFDKIAGVSAKSSKEVIIKQNKDNELFKECLRFLFDGNIVTGLSTKKINKDVGLNTETTTDITHMFNYLKRHSSGRDEDIRTIKTFVNTMDEDLKEFCEGLFTKSLKIGCDTKTVNKVISNLIPTHDVMLANKYEGKLKEEVSMSLKLDGIRCSIVTIEGETFALSRQGKRIEGINYILEEYKDLNLQSYFVDGELIRINHDNIPSDDNFRLTTQLVNSKNDNKEGLEFIVFDMTPMKDYLSHNCNIKYKDRLNLMIDIIGTGSENIKLVDKYGFTDNVNVVNDMLDIVVKRGQEGLILNTLNGKYEFGKRPKSILKCKKFNSADVLCVGIQEGDGRLKNTTGALICKFIYKGEECDVSVGTGLDDSDRKLIFNNPDLVIGKIITIRYFEISKDNKNKKYSLRFPSIPNPILECIRIDKNSLSDTNID